MYNEQQQQQQKEEKNQTQNSILELILHEYENGKP